MSCSKCNYLAAMPPAYATCIALCKKNENFGSNSSDEPLAASLSICCCGIILIIYAITLVSQCNGGFLEFLGACWCPLIYIIFKKFVQVCQN
jgi:hypothetical protein